MKRGEFKKTINGYEIEIINTRPFRIFLDGKLMNGEWATKDAAWTYALGYTQRHPKG